MPSSTLSPDYALEARVVAFLSKFAEESGRIACKYFRSESLVESKSDGTPVTLADREIEALFRSRIQSDFPADSIVGEEYGEVHGSSSYSWVIDPIDGTKSFAAGLLDWGTIAAYCKDGVPLVGLISQPFLQEVAIGSSSGTTLNGAKIEIREASSLDEAVLLLTDQWNYHRYQPAARFEELAARVKMVRSFGNCYQYLLLAAGHVHLALDPIVAKWDLLPLIPIICGAGGVITDFSGNDPLQGSSLLAGTPEMHRVACAILNGRV